MTRVCYEPERYRLSVEGHAGCGDAEKDVICAGLSALWMALEQTLTADRVTVRMLQPVIRYGDGIRSAECCPHVGMGTTCRAMMRTVAWGMRWMAEQYPEYVSYEER